VYDCLNEFYSLKMEEHTSVGIHLANMHGIHMHLILDFDHEIPDRLANREVLRSLPPSYRRYRREYAREAIIKWLLSYSMFMINVYFSC
jgi:hypothetical protein